MFKCMLLLELVPRGLKALLARLKSVANTYDVYG